MAFVQPFLIMLCGIAMANASCSRSQQFINNPEGRDKQVEAESRPPLTSPKVPEKPIEPGTVHPELPKESPPIILSNPEQNQPEPLPQIQQDEARPELAPQPNSPGTLEVASDHVTLQDLHLPIPQGWRVHQEAQQDDVSIIAFSNGDLYVRFYAKRNFAINMRQVFVNGSKVIQQERTERIGNFEWQRLDTQMPKRNLNGISAGFQVAAFSMQYQNYTYYGFARSTNRSNLAGALQSFLASAK